MHKNPLMLFIAMHIKSFSAIVLATTWITPVSTHTLPPMVDPIFHLTIPPSLYQKGFAAVPLPLLKSCGVAVWHSASYRYWILASAEVSGTQYLMIAGLVKNGPSASWSDDKQGVFLWRQGSVCTPIDPVTQVFPYYKMYATDGVKIKGSVFVSLAADAIERYDHAYGSKADFLDALNQQAKYPEASILQRAIADKRGPDDP